MQIWVGLLSLGPPLAPSPALLGLPNQSNPCSSRYCQASSCSQVSEGRGEKGVRALISFAILPSGVALS